MQKIKLNWKVFFVFIFVFSPLSLLKADNCVITFLGHSGFKIELSGKMIFIDTFNPYSNFIKPKDLNQGDADYIFYTHTHLDHFYAKDATTAINNTGAKVVGNNYVLKRLPGVPAEKKIAMNPKLNSPTPAQITLEGGIEVLAFSAKDDEPENCYFFKLGSFGLVHEGDCAFMGIPAPEEVKKQMKVVLHPVSGSPANYPQAQYFFRMHMYGTCRYRGPNEERTLSPGDSVTISISYVQTSSRGNESRIPEIKVYPNPFVRFSTLGFQYSGISDELLKIKVYNLTGRMVEEIRYQVSGIEKAGQLDIKIGEKLIPGIYFVKVKAGNKEIGNKRIIKIR